MSVLIRASVTGIRLISAPRPRISGYCTSICISVTQSDGSARPNPIGMLFCVYVVRLRNVNTPPVAVFFEMAARKLPLRPVNNCGLKTLPVSTFRGRSCVLMLARLKKLASNSERASSTPCSVARTRRSSDRKTLPLFESTRRGAPSVLDSEIAES